jgi:hypothetical protein
MKSSGNVNKDTTRESDMDFQHGDMCIGRAKDLIASGHYIGLIKLMDGTEYAVLQPNVHSHQFSLVYYRTLEPYSGGITYRDRSNEPAKKTLPPLVSSTK